MFSVGFGIEDFRRGGDLSGTREKKESERGESGRGKKDAIRVETKKP